jgi:hypothetical protein
MISKWNQDLSKQCVAMWENFDLFSPFGLISAKLGWKIATYVSGRRKTGTSETPVKQTAPHTAGPPLRDGPGPGTNFFVTVAIPTFVPQSCLILSYLNSSWFETTSLITHPFWKDSNFKSKRGIRMNYLQSIDYLGIFNLYRTFLIMSWHLRCVITSTEKISSSGSKHEHKVFLLEYRPKGAYPWVS